MSGFTPMQVTMKGLLKILNQAKDAGYVTVGGEGSSIPADGTKFQATQNADGSWSFVTDSAAVPTTPTPITVSIPSAKYPAITDGVGTSADSVTLFAVPGVKWRVSAPPTSTGVEYGATWFGGASSKNASVTNGGACEVTAIAEPGYVLVGTTSWAFSFTDVAATTTVTIANAAVPTAQDKADTANDTVTLTKVDGVIWNVDGVNHPSSAFAAATKVVPYAKGVAVTVTANPVNANTVISGTKSWTLQFTNVPAAAPAGGWTKVFPTVDFEGMADGPLPTTTYVGGDGTTMGVKAAKGSPTISSQAVLFTTSNDQTVLLNTGTSTAGKHRFSFRLRTPLEAYNRQVFFIADGTGQLTQVGVTGNNGGFSFVEGVYLNDGAVDTKGTTTYPATVGDLVTLEFDTATNTLTLLINSSVVGSYVATKAIPQVKTLRIRQSAYSASNLMVDDLTAERWV